MVTELTQLAELEAAPGGLGAQAVGLGHPQRVDRLPEGQTRHVAVLVGRVHDAGGPVGPVPPGRRNRRRRGRRKRSGKRRRSRIE